MEIMQFTAFLLWHSPEQSKISNPNSLTTKQVWISDHTQGIVQISPFTSGGFQTRSMPPEIL